MSPRIYAVLVLYKLTPAESSAWQSLQTLAEAMPELCLPSLLVFDNSPQPQHLGASALSAEYISDPANTGLTAAYNTALQRAVGGGFEWLLLLDQDTTLTAEYWSDLLATLPSLPSDVAAVVPQLMEDGVAHSPTQLLRLTHKPVQTAGLLPQPVTAYNSAAVLRVSALQTTGGFDDRFPMEYADHALFAGLQHKGYALWLLAAQVPHTLSTAQHLAAVSPARYAAMLSAEWRYHQAFSTGREKLWYRVRKLKDVLRRGLKPGGVRLALLEARALFGLL